MLTSADEVLKRNLTCFLNIVGRLRANRTRPSISQFIHSHYIANIIISLKMLDGVRALIDGTLLDPRGWYPPPQRPIFPMPWLLVLYTGSFIALLMLPRRARIKIAAPILLILASQFRAVSTGDEITDFLNATVVFGFILKFIDFGLLVQDGEIYKSKTTRKVDLQPMKLKRNKFPTGNRMIVRDRRGIWQRLKDSVELLLLTTRGIGWNWEVRGIPNQNLQSNQYV